MNNNDYRDYLNKIKCSPEFKAKMENLLSAEDNAEYADSVSDVEYMPKFNLYRWTAIAASVALVLGLGGGTMFMLRNDQTGQTQISDMYSSSENSVVRDEIVPDFSEMGIAELKFSEISEGKSITTLDFGELPQAANEAVLDNLNRGNWTEREKFDISDKSVLLTLTWHGDSETEYTVYSSGNAVLSHNGEERYFSIGNYYSLVGIISHYLPYCNWAKLDPSGNGAEIAEIFKENLDGIEAVSNYKYASDHGIEFFRGGSYVAYIDEKGIITVQYLTDSSVYRSVYFQAPEKMYREISELMNIPVAETTTKIVEPVNVNVSTDNEKVYAAVEKEFKDAKIVKFRTGNGQVESDCTFEVSDLAELLNAIKSLKWVVKNEKNIQGEQFIINNIIISKQGEIYLMESGIFYSAENQDLSALNDALDKITESSDIGNIAYMLASSKNNFATVSGNIYRSFNYNGVNVSGSGVAYWDKANSNEYIALENGESTYEFIMQNGYWTFIQRQLDYVANVDDTGDSAVVPENGSVSHTNGFRFYDTPLIDFEWMIMDVQQILDQAIAFPDKIQHMDISKSSGGADVDLVYSDDTGMSTQLALTLDSHGMITRMSKSIFNANYELVSTEEFTFDNCVYDSGDFMIPELTDEQKSYIEEAKP